jgi:hypothetical protein
MTGKIVFQSVFPHRGESKNDSCRYDTSYSTRNIRALTIAEDTMKQNITLSLDKDLIRKARIIAAQRRMSISKILGEELARMTKEEEQYEFSKRKALSDLKAGFHLGGKIMATREELHER